MLLFHYSVFYKSIIPFRRSLLRTLSYIPENDATKGRNVSTSIQHPTSSMYCTEYHLACSITYSRLTRMHGTAHGRAGMTDVTYGVYEYGVYRNKDAHPCFTCSHHAYGADRGMYVYNPIFSIIPVHIGCIIRWIYYLLLYRYLPILLYGYLLIDLRKQANLQLHRA